MSRRNLAISQKEAHELIKRLVRNFPGLLDDEDECSGADVLEWLCNELYYYSVEVKQRKVNREY